MAMSEFGKAFASARKAGDKTFMFKGKKYTTETKDEKDARMAKAEPKAAPKKDMPEAKSSGRGMMAGRRAEDQQETTMFSPKSVMGAGAVARGAAPKARPTQAQQQDAAIAKQARIQKQDEEVGSPGLNALGRIFRAIRERGNTSLPEEMRSKKGGMIKKKAAPKPPAKKMGGGTMKYAHGGSVHRGDGIARKGKTKGRMC